MEVKREGADIFFSTGKGGSWLKSPTGRNGKGTVASEAWGSSEREEAGKENG